MVDATGTRAGQVAWALALALHAAVVVAVARRAPPVRDGEALGASPIELEIFVAERAPAAAVRAPTELTGVSPRVAGGGSPRSVARTVTALPEAPSPEPYAANPHALSVANATEAAPRVITFDVPWTATKNGEAPPPSAPDDANERLRRSLDAESQQHDRKLGLGAVGRVGGQIVAAATPAVRSSGAPDGWAVLAVDLDAAGHTRSVALERFSVAGFAASVDAVRDALGRTTITLPTHFKGAKVRIKIVSRVRLPNGQKARLERSNLFTPSDEPGVEKAPKVGMLHERWWKDALPDLPVWEKLEKTPNSAVVVVPVLDFDVANAHANQSQTVSLTVMELIPES